MRQLRACIGLVFATTICSAQIGVPSSLPVNLTARSGTAITAPPNVAATLIPVTVDANAAGGDLFDIAVLQPGATVTLLTPANVEITAANAVGLGYKYTFIPAGTFGRTMIPNLFASAGDHTAIQLPPNTQQGVYRVKVNTLGVATAAVVVVNYISSSPVRAAVVTASPLYRTGDMVGISGLLFNGTNAITGATVRARVVDLSQTAAPQEVQLLDSGPLDVTPGDGVYTGQVTAGVPGNYDVAMKATGTANGVAFERLAATRFRVLPPLARFVTIADSGVDTNGNGLFDMLNITANVSVQTAGEYQFGITLRASNNRELKRSAKMQLASGTQQIVVSFPSGEVSSLQVNGPYRMADAVLVYLDDPDTPLADKRDDAGLTQAYQVINFELGGLFFNGQNTITPVDTNANGKFDLLRIAAGFTTALAGQYQWSGRLVDRLGREIDFASGSAFWNVGSNLATFQFDGRKIGQNAQNGPYLLRSVLLFGAGQSLVIEQLLQTPAYQVTQFESARCQGDLNNDGVVDTADLAVVRAAFGRRRGQPGFNAAADINQDGIVDIRDLTLVSQNVGCRT